MWVPLQILVALVYYPTHPREALKLIREALEELR